MGQGLIAALLPAIKVLNKFMEVLTKAATKFRDFMYVLTGKKLEGSAKGVVNNLAGLEDEADLSGITNEGEDIGDNMKDAADGMDDATSSAKKLKKALSVLPIDELNQLAGAMEDVSTSKGKGKGKGLADSALGLDDVGLGDMSDMFDSLYDKAEVEPINKWAKAIREAFLKHDWEGVGKNIALMLNEGLKKIYTGIKGITPKVTQAMKNLAEGVNGFIKYFDWELLGKTAGAGISLLVKAFNGLFDTKTGIDFKGLGKGLAKGVRGMIEEIPWVEVGNAIGNGAMIPINMFSGFVEQMMEVGRNGVTGFGEIGIALAEAIEGIFQKIDLGVLGEAAANLFNGITDAIDNFNKTMKENKTWQDIADNITNGLTNAIKGIKPVEAAQALGTLVTDFLGTMLQVAERTPWYELGEKIGDFLINIPWRTIIGQVFGIIENVFGGLIGGLGMKILGQMPQIGNALATGFNNAFAKLGDLAKSDKWSEIANDISGGLNEMIGRIRWAEAGKNLSDFAMKLLDTILQVAKDTDWEGFGEGIGNFLSSIDWGGIFSRVFEIVKESIGGVISGFAETTAGKTALGLLMAFGGMKLAGLGLSVGNLISKELTGQSLITQLFTAITGEGGIVSKVGGFLTTGFAGIFSEGGLLSTVTSGAMGLVSNLGSILGTIGSVIFSPTGLLIGGIIAGVALIIMNWDSVSEVLGNLWNNVLVPLAEFVSNVFASVWSDILSPVLSYLANTVLPILSDTIGNLWNNVLVPLGSYISSTLGPVFSVLGDIIGSLWKNVLVPVAQFVGTVLAGAFEIGAAILNNIVIPAVGAVAKIFQFLGENVIKPLISLIGGTFANIVTSKFKEIGNTVDNLRKIFRGLIDFITGVFSGDWNKAWGGVKKVFEGVWGNLASVVKKPINAIIGFINKLVSGMATGVNDIAKMLNNLNIQIPDWVPGIGGGRLGFNLPTWNPGKIPYLMSGGLIKAPTLAVTGEKYRKEAVLPLENQRTMGMIAKSIMDEAPAGGLNEEMLTNAVSRGVAMAMMNNPQAPVSVTCFAELRTQNDEVLARAVTRGQQSLDYRMNATPQAQLG